MRPCCSDSPLCSWDRLEIAHHCTERHSCRAAAHARKLIAQAVLIYRAGWKLSEIQQQPKGNVWNGHTAHRAAGLRFGDEPGQQDGQVPFRALRQTAAERSKDGILVLHWQEPGPEKGAGPGVPQVLEAHGKPWNTGSGLPAPALGRCPVTQEGDFAEAPAMLCMSQQLPLLHHSRARTSCTGAKSQDTRDGHSTKHEEGCPWRCRGTEHPGPCSALEGTACVHTRTLSAVPLHATALADQGHCHSVALA